MEKLAPIPPERRQTMPEKGDLFLVTTGRCSGLIGKFDGSCGGAFWFLQMEVSDVYAARHNLVVTVGCYPKNLLAVEKPPKHRFDLNEIVEIVEIVADGPLLKKIGIIRAIFYSHYTNPWDVSYSVDLATGANDVLFSGVDLEDSKLILENSRDY